jgi:DNA polymerase-3 subunit beta
VTSSDDLVTISAFARLVGLTSSALRFYADCNLLPPAQVQAGSGYRLYSLEQQPRATLLRSLREVDLPLAEVRLVLDGPKEDAARILHAHLRRLEGKLEPARRTTAMILESFALPADACEVALSGPELVSAVRQVAAAAATTDDIPALACVLLEIGEGEVSFVASDRYRLAIRVLTARQFRGSARLLIPVAALTELAGWAMRHDEVRLTVGDTVTMTAGTEHRPLPTVEAEFPDYRIILRELPPSTTRAIVDRASLLDLLVNGDLPTTVALSIGQDRLVVAGNGSEETVFEAVCTGDGMRLGFATAVLAAALAAGVGPEALLELTAPDQPVLIRSADQGTFTTLAMPTRLQPA